MPNRKFTTSRAVAFWLGLTLHLSLGAALYQQVSDAPTTRTERTERTVHTTPIPSKP